MTKESRLGTGLKGLSAFFDDAAPPQNPTGGQSEAPISVKTPKFADETAIKNGDVVLLPRANLRPNPDQPRKNFDRESIKNLADSIRKEGLLQPILARRTASNVFEIIAGERRWLAAGIAGLQNIPVIVKNLSDEEVFQVALIENLQRENLGPLEEAAGYRALMDRYGHTQQQVADILHKSRPYVANILRLLILPPDVRRMVEQGKLTYSAALAALGEDDPSAAAKKIAKTSKPGRAREAQDPAIASLQSSLSEIFSAPVQIKSKKNKGSITIKFNDIETLDRIMDKLSNL